MIIKDFNNFKLNAKKNCTKRIGQNQAEENVWNRKHLGMNSIIRLKCIFTAGNCN